MRFSRNLAKQILKAGIAATSSRLLPEIGVLKVFIIQAFSQTNWTFCEIDFIELNILEKMANYTSGAKLNIQFSFILLSRWARAAPRRRTSHEPAPPRPPTAGKSTTLWTLHEKWTNVRVSHTSLVNLCTDFGNICEWSDFSAKRVAGSDKYFNFKSQGRWPDSVHYTHEKQYFPFHQLVLCNSTECELPVQPADGFPVALGHRVSQPQEPCRGSMRTLTSAALG